MLSKSGPGSIAALLVALILCLALNGAVSAKLISEHAPVVQDEQPNILLILTDDQDLLLGSLSVMPQVKTRLALEGLAFSNAFVPIPLCCPARATMLTGQYAHNNQIYYNLPPLGGFEKAHGIGLEEATIATALQEAGYRTALIGKYLNGYPLPDNRTYIPPGWDEWIVPVTNSAYVGFQYSMNENGALLYYGEGPANYITDVLARKAADFITRTATLSPSIPFFLGLSFYAPHSPAVPAPRHYGLFPGLKAPRTPSFNEFDVRDKPAYMQTYPPLTAENEQQIDLEYRNRLRSLLAVDEAVEWLLRVLEDVGQLENTYVFFTSDNGYHMGQHRMLAGKGTVYEEDIRVPLLVRGPGIDPGTVRGELVSLVDLAPTFADLAGAEMAITMDGRSLVPLLHSQALPSWRQAVLLEHYRPLIQERYEPGGTLEPPDPWDEQLARQQEPPPDYRGLRTATYKYVERVGGARELYDVLHDPYELRNLIRYTKPQLADALSAWLADLHECAGHSCRQVEAQEPPVLAVQYQHVLPLVGGQ